MRRLVLVLAAGVLLLAAGGAAAEPGPDLSKAPEAEVHEGLADAAPVDGVPSPSTEDEAPTPSPVTPRLEDVPATDAPGVAQVGLDGPSVDRPARAGPGLPLPVDGADPDLAPEPTSASARGLPVSPLAGDGSAPTSTGDALTGPPAPASADDGRRGDHPAIVVAGDVGPTGFVLAYNPLTGEPIYRPGSGVVAGTGTADDPYLIEGWEVPSVTLVGTSAHVRLEDLRVHGGLSSEATDDLVRLEETENVTVASVTASPAPTATEDAAGFQATSDGIQVSGSSNVVVEGSRVSGLLDDGIYVTGTSNLTLRDNTATDNRNGGVWIASVDGAHIEGNLLKGNTWGIDLRGANATIASNDIVANDVGVFVGSGPGHVLRDNRLLRNHNTLAFWGGVAPVVERNLIRWNSGDGIELGDFGFVGSGDDETPVVRKNTLAGPRDEGIEVEEAPGTVVEDNDLHGGKGIEIRGTEGVTVRDNAVASGARYGVELLWAKNATVTDNTIQDVRRRGVWIYQPSGETVVDENTVEDARWTGIRVDEADGPIVVDENTVRGDTVAGIYLGDRGPAEVTGNDLTARLQLGWRVKEAPNLVLDDNTVDGSPLVFRRGVEDPSIPDEAGQVLFVNATDVGIEDRDVGDTPVTVWEGRNVTVRNATFRPGSMLRVEATENVTVRNGSFEDSLLVVSGSGDLAVDGNAFESSHVRGRPGDGGLLFADNTARNASRAVDLEGENLTVVGNELTGNGEAAELTLRNGSTVGSNTIADNRLGLDLFAEDGATIRNNTFRGNQRPGLSIQGGEGAVVADNRFVDDEIGLRPHYYTIDPVVEPSNTVDGDPLRFVAHEEGAHVEAPAGQVVLLNATDAEVEGVEVTGLHRGILVHESADVTIRDAHVDASQVGILARESPRLGVEDTATDGNEYAGLALVDSAHARLRDNAFAGDGVLVYGDRPAHWDHDVDGSNTVNGDPLIYSEGPGDLAPTEPVGQVLATNKTAVHLEDLSLENVSVGAEIAYPETVEVRNVTADDGYVGLAAFGAEEATVRNSTLAGVGTGLLVRASHAEVRNNTASSDHWIALAVSAAPDTGAVVADNVVDPGNGWAYGLALGDLSHVGVQDGEPLLVAGNDVADGGAISGIQVDVPDARLAGNTVTGNRYGVVLDEEGIHVENSTIAEAQDIGILATWTRDVTVEHNVLRDNPVGYRSGILDGPQAIHGNTFTGNDVGILAPEPYDARENYWGCPDGPRDPACDPVVGPAQVEPWLSSPHPDAGAG